MAKKKPKNTQTVFDVVVKQDLNIHHINEEIKLDDKTIGSLSKERLKQKRENLKAIKQYEKNQAKPILKEIRTLEKKIEKEPNYFEKLKLSYEREYLVNDLQRKKLDLSAQENEIKRLAGKDFYYSVDTGFKQHKIWRSQLGNLEDNSIFLNLLKTDVENEIKKLQKSYDPRKESKIKILKDKLLPVILFNIEVDQNRAFDINSVSKELQEKIDLALDRSIDNKEKDGVYIMLIVMSNELIKLL